MQITLPFQSYPYLRFIAVFAGLFGIIQSLLWLGLSITAIIAYYCNIDFTGTGANFGSLLILTINEMYFRGECIPPGLPNVNFDVLTEFNTMSPSDINIWMWVVAALSLLWLFASVALITNVKKSNMKYLNVFLFIWIITTFVVIVIDLVLFVLFILDYIEIMEWSFERNLNNFPTITNSVIITAQNTAGIMASVALRGYLMWLINLCLVIFLMTQTFKIYDYNKIQAHDEDRSNGRVNRGFDRSNDDFKDHSIFRNEPPIQAFNETSPAPWYNYLTKDIPRVHRHSQYPPPLVRSLSATSFNETRRNQAPARPASVEPEVILRREQVQQELRYRQSLNSGRPTTAVYEQRPQLKSAMRNSRYQ